MREATVRHLRARRAARAREDQRKRGRMHGVWRRTRAHFAPLPFTAYSLVWYALDIGASLVTGNADFFYRGIADDGTRIGIGSIYLAFAALALCVPRLGGFGLATCVLALRVYDALQGANPVTARFWVAVGAAVIAETLIRARRDRQAMIAARAEQMGGGA